MLLLLIFMLLSCCLVHKDLVPTFHFLTQDNLSDICLQQDGAYLLVERGFSLATQFYLLGSGNELRFLGNFFLDIIFPKC